ncbi:MAG: hypothetical protein HUU23_03570 [Caldilineales bacterium]|nr:hypothetical protein [Caldilineales bacterium]
MSQLAAPWRFLARGFLLLWDELALMLGLSLLLALSLLLILPAPAVAAGLAVVARRMAREERVNFDFFKEGVRAYARLSYLVLGVWLAVLALLVINVWFYARLGEDFFRAISFLWLYLGLLWLALLPHLLPTLLELQAPTVWLVFRNTALLLFSAPLYLLSFLAQLGLWLLLLRYLPLLFFLGWGGWLALVASQGVHYLIGRVSGADADHK